MQAGAQARMAAGMAFREEFAAMKQPLSVRGGVYTALAYVAEAVEKYPALSEVLSQTLYLGGQTLRAAMYVSAMGTAAAAGWVVGGPLGAYAGAVGGFAFAQSAEKAFDTFITGAAPTFKEAVDQLKNDAYQQARTPAEALRFMQGVDAGIHGGATVAALLLTRKGLQGMSRLNLGAEANTGLNYRNGAKAN